ncbi:transferrin-like [Condylostylus longicornis]|uniref:transferrin-like n=1 Tax=Condylostylus longicornis TaxID=2530218 RepID=UPI00244E453F|nr:transferrin-like [Condylostylus longicornis]
MCVAEEYLDECKDFLGRYSIKGPNLECIAGRDRIDCLELIQKNEAHIMAVDPEDAYLAAELDNQAFRIIGELRYKETDKFEDEDQILIKKSSTIQSLKDLKGLKACFPKFNSYYGYRIPVFHLKQHGILEVSQDPSVPAYQRELKALSTFFDQACIIGPYSEDESVDQRLKRKYSNLCQLCENPVDCNENDKYADYDGAINCLVNGGGDVAFTGRNTIRNYFGLTGDEENDNVNINDYEYLCVDGTRQPINGTGCSLAKKPNRAYITRTNITEDYVLHIQLISQLEVFFRNAIKHMNTDEAKKLLIVEGMKFHELEDVVEPKDYVKEFEDFIVRDESYTYKAKLCVTTHIELEKCEMLAKAALTSEVRPKIECYLSEKSDCAADVASDNAHIAVVPGYNWARVEKKYPNLKRIAYEGWNFNEPYIAIFTDSPYLFKFNELPIKFDHTDKRAHKAACLLHLSLGGTQECDKLDGNITETTENYIHVVDAAERHLYGKEKILLCLDETRSHRGDYFACNLDLYYQNAIYVNGEKSRAERDSFKNALTTIGNIFGHEGNELDVFDLFGQFKGNDDVLFTDYTMRFDGVENFEKFDEKYYDLIMKVLQYNWKEDDSTK